MRSEPTITIVMLGEPVPFARAAGGRTVVRFTPKKQRNAVATLRVLAHEQMIGRAPLEGPLRLDLVAEFPIPRSWSKKRQAAAVGVSMTGRPDYDNLAKLASDALNGIVYRDDAQISDAAICKRYSNQAKITLRVTPKEF